eukprot:snap_masked-scaffold_93-processed-gene-0.28-mRNA-1 protein AED:1.00 eAED:1.00 QI:0/-1/0/0/-1/1/1/0/165
MSTNLEETPQRPKTGKRIGLSIATELQLPLPSPSKTPKSVGPRNRSSNPSSAPKKRRKRSQWHQYFNSDEEDENFTTCKTCGARVKCRNGTSSMKWHVLNQCESVNKEVNDPNIVFETKEKSETGINRIRFRVDAGKMKDQVISLRDSKAIITLNLPLTIHLSLN